MIDNFGLYVIATRPSLSYGRVAEICVERGIKYLQLREKHLSDKQLLAAAHEIKSVTKGSDTMFVINDRADLALLSQADCLHIGQDDISILEARQLLGADFPIGISTHSLAQAEQAMAQNPHYIGFGPVYSTTTKANPDPTVGTELLSQVLSISTVPVVAIGGIFPDNITSVLEAGARNLSLVRHLMQDDMDQKIESIQNMISEYWSSK